jgi:hypothetical protein
MVKNVNLYGKKDCLTLPENSIPKQSSSLGESLRFFRLFPDLGDLFFYLDNLLLVAATFMIRDLCFELLDLLGVLPGD